MIDVGKIKEPEILEFLLKKDQLHAFMSFMVMGAYRFPDYDDRLVRLKVAINVDRMRLGLDPNSKPGDIDILAIPVWNDIPEFNKTIAIEVKISRPTIAKPSKSPSSLGATQARGLFSDGFPYCGLLHLVVAEPLPESLKLPIPIMSNKVDADGNLQETGETQLSDLFGCYSTDRQFGRLETLGLPVNIGLCSMSVDISENGRGRMVMGVGFGHNRFPGINPEVSNELIQCIAHDYALYPELYSG